jgi:uncharacterized iron-regulated membrane protein
VATLTYRAIWRWHFHAGLFCIPFVLILALTGSIYLFKPQIDAFADRAVDSLQLAGPRATGEAHIAAALASEPGSKIFTYEIPREPDDAVRVHVYAADGSGHIVFVHPQTLAILKTVPHAARLTEFVRMVHANLLVGRKGAILLELAASWAIIMIVSGLYLWWPRETRGLAGALYPRLRLGRRVFWRDLHAVTGLWISALALFLLLTALPWTPIWGAGFDEVRQLAATDAQKDWSTGGTVDHGTHRPQAPGEAVASRVTLDGIVQRVDALHLAPPVRVYLPSEQQPYWRVRSETQNRPRVRELELDLHTGAVLRDQKFADKPLVDRVVGVGVAAHEGQLFGPANQALGLAAALGFMTLCVSGIVMWWRRRPDGSLGIPARRVPDFEIRAPLGTAIVALGVLLPVLGASLLALIASGTATRLLRPRP